jgi:hypothetical protein
MPKVIRFPSPISASPISSDKSDGKRSDFDAFVQIALFSGVGLLISLLAVMFHLSGAWY